MRSSALAVVIAMALAACDERLPPPTPPDCQALALKIYQALDQAGGTCDTVDDCDMMGGGTQTCDCAAQGWSCGGEAVAKNAPGLAMAQQRAYDFVIAGCRGDKVCDCAPSGPLACVDHQCVAPLRSCLTPPPDAAPDAPELYDAPVTPDAPL